jgi:hypothetical protein
MVPGAEPEKQKIKFYEAQKTAHPPNFRANLLNIAGRVKRQKATKKMIDKPIVISQVFWEGPKNEIF